MALLTDVFVGKVDTVFCRLVKSLWFAFRASPAVSADVEARPDVAAEILVKTSVDFAKGTRLDVSSLDFARLLRDVRGAYELS